MFSVVNSALAALSTGDQEAQMLERKVGDDPRTSLLEGKGWRDEGLKRKDIALQLLGQRLLVMATSALEENVELAKFAEEGLALANLAGDQQAICEFLSAKATALASAGKHEQAFPLLDEAVEIAKKASLERTKIGIDLTRAYVLTLVGKDAEALELISKAHQSYVDIGDAEGARNTLSTIGNSYRREGASRADLQRALGYLQQSIFPDSEKTRRHDLSTSYYNMALIYEELKDLSNAKLLLEKSRALSTALNDPIGIAFCNTRLGNIAAERGAWDEALNQANSALPEIRRAGDSTMIFNIQRLRAKALAHLSRRKESLEALREADSLRGDVAWKDAVYLRSSAEVYAALGEYEKAYSIHLQYQKAEAASLVLTREKDAITAQAVFELKQKESENEMLRIREKESDARRLVLILTVVLLLITLGGLALFLHRQNQQNQRYITLALRDDLTGLPNRRSILNFAHTQIRAVLGDKHSQTDDKHPLCLALIDIDHFKTINDNYGHAVGDAVLTAFASTCQKQLRAEDRIGRYGGEEFLLILPNFSLQQMSTFFDALRDEVRKIRSPELPAEHVLAFSMGVAETDDAADVDSLIKRADDALYKAKASGRDRFEIG